MALNRLSTVVSAAVAIAALLPGALLLSGLVPLPPTFNQLLTICGSVMAPLLVLVSTLVRAYIARLHVGVAAGISIILMSAGFATAFDYWQFASARIEPIDYVANHLRPDGHEFVIMPSTPSSNLSDLLEEHGSIGAALVDRADGANAELWLARDSRPDQLRMFWELLAAEALLLLAFLIGAWRVAPTVRESRARRKSSEDAAA